MWRGETLAISFSIRKQVVMNFIHGLAGVVVTGVALCLGVEAGSQEPSQAEKEASVAAARKEQVVALLKSLETGGAEAAKVLNPSRYVEHNLDKSDGTQAFLNVLKRVSPHSARVNTVRVFQDGDFVFTHTEYTGSAPKIGFDIFRFEGDKIVEHWDNVQDKPEKPNPSGHTMVDGPTEASDASKMEINKRIVQNYIEDTLIHGRLDKMASYFHDERYIQHNPRTGDGLAARRETFKARAKQGVVLKFDRIHKILGEGNFVLAVSEGRYGPSGGMPTCFYDLFRLEDGKIAEHWDTVAVIPEKVQWKNGNGKFGF